ncbi:hypothetical protein [Mucilaginibacter gilvus]|uniref:hypothetical protein n=1 Tax=Mucilaginibacter gilvus TaxID=2305909 RepID=UPI0026B4FD4C|nr:hypothetical protein [Mucilaginibacter gilvus]
MQVNYFEHEVVFQQKIMLKSVGPVTVTGILGYGACNDRRCNPPEDVAFSIAVK